MTSFMEIIRSWCIKCYICLDFDKYAKIRSIRCCDVFVFLFDLLWQIHITVMIKIIKINSIRCCDSSSLSWYDLYNIYISMQLIKIKSICVVTSLYLSLSWHDKYTKYILIKVMKIETMRCCDFFVFDLSLSWHDKYTKYISIKLIKIKSIRCCDVRVSRAHCWNSEGKLLSTNTNAADHSLFTSFFFKIWILFFLEAHLNKYWCNSQSFFFQSDLHLLHWEVYEFNTKDS